LPSSASFTDSGAVGPGPQERRIPSFRVVNTSSPTQTMTSLKGLDDWDLQAMQVLQAIRCFIDALRSASYPAILSGSSTQQKQREHASSPSVDAEFSLVEHLRSAGVFDLVKQLEPEILHNSDCNPIHSHQTMDERCQILYEVVFPLLTHLHHCYTILDNAPQPPLSSDSQSKWKNKPQPTNGMLSLNDYTNVACLLEFSMCSSLITRMEYFQFWDADSSITEVKMSFVIAQKRIKSLPKSLAGRISSSSLFWGTFVAYDCWSKTIGTPDQRIEVQLALLDRNNHELSRLANSVGQLVLLDRFRPMLLPRHLADLYLTSLFLERSKWKLSKMLVQTRDCSFDATSFGVVNEKEEKMLHSLQLALRLSPLKISSSMKFTHQALNSTENEFGLVDCREAALAYRTLFSEKAAVVTNSQSTNTIRKPQCRSSTDVGIPPWLRMRLGQCLTKLAEADLHAVVDVFVASASGIGSGCTQHDGDVMTGAAARLARALCARPSTNGSSDVGIAFQKTICHQFVNFLVAEGEGIQQSYEVSKKDATDWAPSRSSLAMIYTLWATIAQLPEAIVRDCFGLRLISGLTIHASDASPLSREENEYTDQLTATQSTSALCVWFSVPPTALDQSTIQKVHSVVFNSISLPYKTLKQSNAEMTMFGQVLRLAAAFRHESAETKLVIEATPDLKSREASRQISDLTLGHIACGLLRDEVQVKKVALELVKAVATNYFDGEGYIFCSSPTSDPAAQPRMSYALKPCNTQGEDISTLLQEVEQRAKILMDAVISPLSTAVDHIFVDGEKSSSEHSDQIECSLPCALFRIVLIIHFTSSFSSEDIEATKMLSEFGFDLSLQNRLEELRIAAAVLLGFLCERCSTASILLADTNDKEEMSVGIVQLLGIIINCAADRLKLEPTSIDSFDASEELFSTTSIVVSLLVSLLELGAKKRSGQDELCLQSLLLPLEILSSSPIHSQYQCPKECDPETSTVSTQLAELAEMSSHAMALIVARKGEDDTNKEEDQVSPTSSLSFIESIAEKLSIAERDLQSIQPPIRARAVVSLRHIAHSLTLDGTPSGHFGTDEHKIMVAEIESQSSAEKLSRSDHLGLVARSLARICMISLSDSESYVYLASIQTLVAICDLCPSEMLVIIATLVANGKNTFTILSSQAEVSSESVTLNPEQRIKCAEALIFMIRRRGNGIYLHGRLLLDLMIFGSKQSHLQDQVDFNSDISRDMQSQTHSFFVGKEEEDGMEEKQLRINTGGPVFEIEEVDLLRATAISVVCEVISALESSVVASYCHILVSLAIDALQLDSSRPVRRAAALLARELYACIENELNDGHSTAAMAVAMVRSRENALYNALSCCIAGNNVGKVRHLDAATQSRCVEAVEIRNQLESLSVFDAAAFIEQSMNQENQAVVRAVRKILP
jgi:hypothetical protein